MINVETKSTTNINIEKYLKDPQFMSLVKKYAEESEKFNKENKTKLDKEHDKIFKMIFSRKKEVAKFLSKILKIKVKSNDLVASQNNFVTTELKYREADIVYKLKNRNIVFLIEHQTKVDYRMAYRILNYQVEIMRANEVDNPKKDTKECLVIPIVLYTGKGKWTAKNYIREIQEKLFLDENVGDFDFGTLGYYTLVDINNYTRDELMQEKTMLSKIILLEKERNTNELLYTMFEINEKIKEIKDKKIIYDAMYLVLNKKFGNERADKIIEKLIKEGSDYMLAAEEMVMEENRRIKAEGINIGKSQGISIGRSQGINIGKSQGISIGRNQGKRISIINMLKMGFPIETISKISETSEDEIKKIAKNNKKR